MHTRTPPTHTHTTHTPNTHAKHTRSNGKWDVVPGEALLPGDIISIGRPSGEGGDEKVVPAGEQLLLVRASCAEYGMAVLRA
jgi:hypothetical protein